MALSLHGVQYLPTILLLSDRSSDCTYKDCKVFPNICILIYPVSQNNVLNKLVLNKVFRLITNPFYTKDFQFFLRISVGGKEKCTKLQSNKDARGGKADFSLCFDEWKYFSIQVCQYSELFRIQWSAVSDVFTEFMCSDLMLEDLYHTVMLILYTVLISSFIREQQFYPKHWSNLYSAIFQFSEIVFVWCAYVFSPSFMPVFESFFNYYSDTWAEFQCCESQSSHGGASFLWAWSKRSQTNGQCFLQRVESSQCMAVFCFVFDFFFVQILNPSINKTIFIQESIVTHQFNVMLNKQVTTRFTVVCVWKENNS